MSLTRRLIVCLDVADGRVVKGRQFKDLRDVGDPASLAARYEQEGADEVAFLDIAASAEGRDTLLGVLRRTAERLFIPLTVGGGVRSADDVARVLRAGADKVSINSAAVERPRVLTEAAQRFGAQCVVVSIDAKRRADERGWEVYVRGGRVATGMDAVAWATEAVARGAGEVLLTSIDRDGSRDGYDLELTRAVAAEVSVPVIASGGAGEPRDVMTAFRDGWADAALVAGIVHDRRTTIAEIKRTMRDAGIPTRSAA